MTLAGYSVFRYLFSLGRRSGRFLIVCVGDCRLIIPFMILIKRLVIRQRRLFVFIFRLRLRRLKTGVEPRRSSIRRAVAVIRVAGTLTFPTWRCFMVTWGRRLMRWCGGTWCPPIV